MVEANVENEPISIVLANNASLTVPDGEVWNVLITGRAAARSSDGHTLRAIEINGEPIATSACFMDGDSDNGRAAVADTTFPAKAVLVGGDVVTAVNTSSHVSGFVVRKP